MANQKIKCQDCGEEFNYTDRDQEFYAQNGWNPPKRCKFCRQNRKESKFNKLRD